MGCSRVISHADLCALVAQGYEQSTGKVNEVEYHVIQLPLVQVLTFRGTEASKMFSGCGWRDVIRDLRVMPWHDDRAGWCHAGFLKGARGVIDGPLELTRDKPIVTSGHSLGAAMSLIAALMLESIGYDVYEWVGFGCPRAILGDRLYGFDATSYRHKNDIVTQVPPLFFEHLIDPIQLGEPEGSPSFKHHDIGLYLEYLESVS